MLSHGSSRILLESDICSILYQPICYSDHLNMRLAAAASSLHHRVWWTYPYRELPRTCSAIWSPSTPPNRTVVRLWSRRVEVPVLQGQQGGLRASNMSCGRRGRSHHVYSRDTVCRCSGLRLVGPNERAAFRSDRVRAPAFLYPSRIATTHVMPAVTLRGAI